MKPVFKTRNANLSIKKAKNGKKYLCCVFETKEGQLFTFELSPKFLNKKQYRFLMVNVVKYEKE